MKKKSKQNFFNIQVQNLRDIAKKAIKIAKKENLGIEKDYLLLYDDDTYKIFRNLGNGKDQILTQGIPHQNVIIAVHAHFNQDDCPSQLDLIESSRRKCHIGILLYEHETSLIIGKGTTKKINSTTLGLVDYLDEIKFVIKFFENSENFEDITDYTNKKLFE